MEVFAANAHDSSRYVGSFGARGPSCFGTAAKPNVSAPGIVICGPIPPSSWTCGYSGTSLSGAYGAGSLALLLSCAPGLIGDAPAAFNALQSTADTPPDGNCGLAPGGGNYTYGHGYINLLAAGQAYCGFQRPEPAWDKDIYVNDVLTPIDAPIPVKAGDIVVVVDRVSVAFTEPVTFTLSEWWTESLTLTQHEATTGTVIVGAGVVDWEAIGFLPGVTGTLTKTYEVGWGMYETDRITEVLMVEGAAIIEPVIIEFEYQAPDIVVGPLFLGATLNPGDATMLLLNIANDGDSDLTFAVTEAVGVDWLSESPITGTVLPLADQDVDVIFDATGLAVGVYTETLEIESNDFDEPLVLVSVVLTVTDECMPIVGADFTWAPLSPVTGEPVQFDATVDSGTEPITYEWDFGDGDGGMGQSIQHAYLLSGTYTVLMTATNECSVETVDYDLDVIGEPVEAADLSIDKADSADPVYVGDTFTYTLTVENLEGVTATNVLVTDTLPADVTFVTATLGCTEAAGVVVCDLGDLAVGETAVVNIVVTADAAGTLTNHAEVAGDQVDPLPDDNHAMEETVVLEVMEYFIYLPTILKAIP
jgi:uncharacterized repeat protein (TIGR01451 family)